jgi:hypothetical protein
LDVTGNYARFFENASGAEVYIRGYYGSANVAAIQVVTNSPLAFLTQNSERARIDASGNMGVGTTSPSQRLDVTVSSSTEGSGLAVTNSLTGGYGSGLTFYSLRSDTSAKLASASVGVSGTSSWSSDATTSSALTFSTVNANTFAERARITSAGQLLIAKTGNSANATIELNQAVSASANIYMAVTGTSSIQQVIFGNGNGTVGSISTNGSATTYSTSSDYRLKNTIAPITGALAKVALLNPVTYKWNVDGSDGEGFIAHELAEVVPDCVTGEKDAVDADGKPKYQGIDTSFLVATLTAAIQEQQALIQSLKARLDAANL